MDRYIYSQVAEDMESKVVLISGPRQSGKTTFSKLLLSEFDYLNYDYAPDRLKIISGQWDREKPLIIFDELHKHHEWKRFLKGIFDVDGIPPRLVVTGSAKMDVFRKVGDSLAGRYFNHHLFPLDLKELELNGNTTSPATLEQLLAISGFPEPFLKGTETFYSRWSRSHLDVILRQDLQDLSTVRHINDIETLIELLKHCVGSTISYSSLARDLNTSPQTVKNWLILLENLYIIFKITPYTNSIRRSIQKEPKYYFYDTAAVKGDIGSKYENLVAFSLYKWLQFTQDTTGKKCNLHYLKTRNGEELDFLITIDDHITHVIESKWADSSVSKSFSIFQKQIQSPHFLQLVHKLEREYSTTSGIKVCSASKWLSKLDLKS